MRITYEDHLRGRAVVDATGRVLGEVAGLFVDADTWKVEAIQVKLRREAADVIGVHRGTFRAAQLTVSSEFIQSVGDAVVLRKDAADLRPHPERTEPPAEGPRPPA
ncbi:MAG: PRC-barrel domain-containing protein [Polyangiaceae bacterium]|nr:PRC-barrel domain-containing protein [Polyangiaceae bacterium]